MTDIEKMERRLHEQIEKIMEWNEEYLTTQPEQVRKTLETIAEIMVKARIIP